MDFLNLIRQRVLTALELCLLSSRQSEALIWSVSQRPSHSWTLQMFQQISWQTISCSIYLVDIKLIFDFLGGVSNNFHTYLMFVDIWGKIVSFIFNWNFIFSFLIYSFEIFKYNFYFENIEKKSKTSYRSVWC